MQDSVFATATLEDIRVHTSAVCRFILSLSEAPVLGVASKEKVALLCAADHLKMVLADDPELLDLIGR